MVRAERILIPFFGPVDDGRSVMSAATLSPRVVNASPGRWSTAIPTAYDRSAFNAGGRVQTQAEAAARVFHRDQPTPQPSIAKVTANDAAGGNLASPKMSATKIFEPINTSNAAKAYLR